MPSSPYAKVLMRIDGGAPVSGGQTVAGGNAIQLGGESTSGWVTALWEIYQYPIGWSVPSGWTNVNGVYQSTSNVPTSFTIASTSFWGKYLFRLTVNGGLLGGVYAGLGSAQPLVDVASGLLVLSPNGQHDIGYGETNQFDSSRQYIGELQKTLRAIEAALGGGGGGGSAGGSTTQFQYNNAGSLGGTANVTYVSGFAQFATDIKLTNSGFALRLSPGTLGANATVTLPGSTTTLLGTDTTNTVTNKTLNTTNNTVTATSQAAGDLLKNNGTKFARFAMGTALQVLRVNAGGTDLEWAATSGGGSIEVDGDGASVVASATIANFIGMTVASAGGGQANITGATRFDGGSTTKNLRAARPSHQSAIDNTKNGIVNLGSDVAGGAAGATGSYSTILGGDHNSATGDYSLAGSQGATASGPNAIALGNEATASAAGAVALGTSASAGEQDAVALGNAATVNAGATSGFAVGFAAVVENPFGVAIGWEPVAIGTKALALGPGAQAWGDQSAAIGDIPQAFGDGSTALGFETQSKGAKSLAANASSIAAGDGSAAFGAQAVAAREAQLALAAGNFSDTAAGSAGGQAQSSQIVLRATTPGNSTGETGTFKFGELGVTSFLTEKNRAYSCRLTVMITGKINAGAEIYQKFVVDFDVLHRTTAAVVVNSNTQTGSGGASTFTVDVDNPLTTISFNTAGVRARCNAVALLEFVEVIYPITTPLDVANCTLWLKADGLSAGALTSWADGSATGATFAQATAANKPTVVASDLNGLSGVHFDGTNDSMTTVGSGKHLSDIVSSGGGAGGAYTLFIVGNFDAAATSGTNFPTLPSLITDSVGAWGVSGNNSNLAFGWQAHAAATYDFSAGAWAASTPIIQSFWEEGYGGGTIVRLEQSQGRSDPAVSSAVYDLTGTLSLGVSSNGSNFAQCKIYEIVAYKRALTDGERQQVTQYLKEKWLP